MSKATLWGRAPGFARKEGAMSFLRFLRIMAFVLGGAWMSSVSLAHAAPLQGGSCSVYVGSGYTVPIPCPKDTPPAPAPSPTPQLPGSPIAGDPCSSPDVMANCAPVGGYKTWGYPTDVPRTPEGRIIFHGMSWPTGAMTFERARAEQDALWAWQHLYGYPRESQVDDQDLIDYLAELAALAEQNQPAPEATAQPAPEATAQPVTSPSAQPNSQCDQLKANLESAKAKAKEIAQSLAQVEARINAQKGQIGKLQTERSSLIIEESGLVDEIARMRAYLQELQSELRSATDDNHQRYLIQQIADLRAEIQDAVNRKTAVQGQIVAKDNLISAAQRVLGSLESDKNDLTAAGRYQLGEIARLEQLISQNCT